MPRPKRVFQFFLRMARAFIPNKIFSCSLTLGTSVYEKNFQIGNTVLDLKLDEGRVLGSGDGNHPLPWIFFTYFSNHKDDIQS